MITIFALILSVITSLMGAGKSETVVVIPPMPMYLPDSYEQAEEIEWLAYEAEAYWDACDEFDAIYNAIEYKRSKNGRSMVKGINSTSFKFAKKG